ncbi:hypothetical protein Bca52824_068681 [Brassica carinata]|uniref:Uncharacterized protein n=1 Tax=Brassica carinata TaxID=52824 RepID=A0A8X7U0P8_BRACI|nr:hypothetical protein Bca52824_068681 [Brassica carinata]
MLQQQHLQKSENREIMTETTTKTQVFEEKQRVDRKSLIVHHPQDDSEKGSSSSYTMRISGSLRNQEQRKKELILQTSVSNIQLLCMIVSSQMQRRLHR